MRTLTTLVGAALIVAAWTTPNSGNAIAFAITALIALLPQLVATGIRWSTD